MASVTKTKGNLSVRAHIGDSKDAARIRSGQERHENLADSRCRAGRRNVPPFILNELQFKTPTDHAQDATLPPTPASTRRSTSSGGCTCLVPRTRG